MLDINVTKGETLTEVANINLFKVRKYPQVIKYMGSKAKLLDFVVEGISEIYNDGPVCDLFSGACSLSGALGGQVPIISNDIQRYSKSIAHSYLFVFSDIDGQEIIEEASKLVSRRRKILTDEYEYTVDPTLNEFQKIEDKNKDLINRRFSYHHHLFVKYYSGTWWSGEQCLWIDAIREVADGLLSYRKIKKSDFEIILTCLMHAMAYCSQGTGHYAQYRDAKTVSSMKDINKYRQSSIKAYFLRKFNSLKEWNQEEVINLGHKVWSLDYRQCLKKIPKSTVYADPPYAFVHYSRFYHAIETLVRYDFPEIQVKNGNIVKGRYREDRHQSPFCIRTQVKGAFSELFEGVKNTNSNLVLSYSNTGMITLAELLDLAKEIFGTKYECWAEDQEHTHMTMGRKEDRSRTVKEALVMVSAR